MALSDRLGLAVSTSSSEALTTYEQGLDLALRWRSGTMDALHTAVVSDPPFHPGALHEGVCGFAHGAGRYRPGSAPAGADPAG